MLKPCTLAFLLIGGSLSGANAQTSWTLGSAVRKGSPTDTLRGWFKYQDQLHFQPQTGGPQQLIPVSEISRLQTQQGEVFVPAPAALSSTASRLMSEVVAGPISLLRDESTPKKPFYLVMPADQAVELSPITYLQQLQHALPDCPATSIDSLTTQIRKFRYQARSLGPLIARYNRCRYPTEPARLVLPRVAAKLTGGFRAGVQTYQLVYLRTKLLQDTNFGTLTAVTGGVFARLTFNQRFYLQPELNYQQLRGEGTVSVPTNTSTYSSFTTSSVVRDLAVGNLLARYHIGLPVAGKWRPVLLAGLSGGYALKSEYTLNNALVYTDGTPTISANEPSRVSKWNSGYVGGLGLEAPFGHRPTLEARYYATYFDAAGMVERTIKAEILELQLSFSW